MTGHANVRTVLRVALVLAVGLGPAYAQATNDAVQGAAESWVGLVDGAKYAESWQAAASSSGTRCHSRSGLRRRRR